MGSFLCGYRRNKVYLNIVMILWEGFGLELHERTKYVHYIPRNFVLTETLNQDTTQLPKPIRQ